MKDETMVKGKPDETRGEKWSRLMNGRGKAAADAIRLMGNLASADYDYDMDAVHSAAEQLRDGIDRMVTRHQLEHDRRARRGGAGFSV